MTPYYYVDEGLVIQNLEKLKSVMERTHCKILLAQKAFSMYSLYPLIGKYLNGTTASSFFEAHLGRTKMGGETHIFSPAYIESEFGEIVDTCDTIVFNSMNQWEKLRDSVKNRRCGLRINPEYCEVEVDKYAPCGKYSRLGITRANFPDSIPDGITGLHFHCLCEQNADVLMRTVDVVIEKYSKHFPQISWLNLGGGHHITRGDYDLDLLCDTIERFNKWNLEIYLEPGEAVVLNAGFLVCRVIDKVHNGKEILILDASAACHAPDVLDMPYRPPVLDEVKGGEFSYILAGPTCLAGDVFGEYAFDHIVDIGDVIVFGDMAHYSMVKNTTFNGINLPSIYTKRMSGTMELVRKFGYQDFESRL